MKNTKISSPRAILPKITDMLIWKVVKPNDILVASGTSVEARLLPNGHVLTDDDEELSIQKWLCGVYGWTSVETYKYTIHKETGRTLSDLRREYMEREASAQNNY